MATDAELMRELFKGGVSVTDIAAKFDRSVTYTERIVYNLGTPGRIPHSTNKVLAALSCEEPRTAADVAAATGFTCNAARVFLFRLHKRGAIVLDGVTPAGRYLWRLPL